MKIEHYTVGMSTRWRIREDSGLLKVQGLTYHSTIGESQSEVRVILDFLEAVERERTGKALRGELDE